MTQTPIRTAVAGIGGFASVHHEHLLQLEEAGVVKVVATCDPNVDRLAEVRERWRFAGRGIRVYDSFEAMLAAHEREIDLIAVAAPIRLHAPMHRACVERGIPCYLEKPPTLDPVELEEMIALDATARFATQVGFNYIHQPFRQKLKKRILDGEFGPLRRIGFLGLWPRELAYYGRNGWAGRLLLHDYVLLDSCCGNAMSHHLHNILFFAGQEGLFSWANPATVEAELYRANAIEGIDTAFARGLLENGVEFRLACTHACGSEAVSRETIVCENATLEIEPGKRCLVRHRDGRCEEIAMEPLLLADHFQLYCDYIRGAQERPSSLLADCRPFVRLNALLYLAAGRIQTLAAPAVEETIFPGGRTATRHIPGVLEVSQRAVESGKFPSEQGVAWAAPGGTATAEALDGLRGKLREMAVRCG